MKIPYFIPDITEAEKEAIIEVLQNPSENLVPKLEQTFKQYIDVQYAVSAVNGAAAFQLCLFAMNLKRGDKILCSVNCHPMFPEMIRHFDAEPIFVDIQEDTFEISYEKCQEVLKNNMSKKLRAIVVSHTAGQVCDIKPFCELAKSYQIKVIEDATMALGLTHKGVKIGSQGSYASIFSIILDSTNPVAQAGILATNDEELARQALLMRYHGVVSEDITSVRPQYLYDVVGIGNKHNISLLDVAFCLKQLERIDEMIKKRQKLAKFYIKTLGSAPHLSMPSIKREHIFYHFIIKVDKNRDHFAKELKECGIETGLHFVPLHLLTYYKTKYRFKISDFPVALKNYQQILSLPIYSVMKEKQIDYVCEQILRLVNERF